MSKRAMKHISGLAAVLVCILGAALAASVPRPILGEPGTYYTYTGALQYARDTNTVLKDRYTLSGQTSGTNAATYTVTATLKDPGEDADYWNDGGGPRRYAPEQFKWTIEKLNLWDKSIVLSGSSFDYDGTAKTPFSHISGYPNLKADDISVTYRKGSTAYAAPVEAGTWTVSVSGRSSNLTDHSADSVTFVINQLDLSGKGITLGAGPFVFQNGDWRPFVAIAGYPELKASDYTVKYANNYNAGTASVTVTGNAPNCKGSTSATFEIVPAPLPSNPVLAYAEVVYDGQPKQPSATISGLTQGRDFSLAYDADVTSAGWKTVVATGMGNYSDSSSTSAKYNVVRRPLAASYVDIAGIPDAVYTGAQITPQPAVSFSGVNLSGETDFRYFYGANTDAGSENTVTITARDGSNYQGSQSTSFSILPQPVTVPEATQELTFSGLEQAAPVPQDARYVLAGALSATNAGTYEVTAALISSNYRWEDNGTAARPVQWRINTLDLDQTRLDDIPAQLYTGSAIFPEAKVRLDGREMSPATGFALSYGSNVEAGEGAGRASIAPASPANYTPGTSQSTAFDITPKNLADADVIIEPISAVTYTGLQFTPVPRVTYLGNTLAEGTDFVCTYGDNTGAGDGHSVTLTAAAAGNYQGSKTVYFVILPKSLAEEQVTIEAVAPIVYTGLQQRPEPRVAYLANTLAQGNDFVYSYGKNTDAGDEHTVTITASARGNYEGSKTVAFVIEPRDISDEAVFVAPLAPAYDYTAQEHRPKPSVEFSLKGYESTLSEGIDFSYGYNANISGGMPLSNEAGKPTVTIAGMGNFSGSRQLNFVITDSSAPEIAFLEDRGGEITFLVKDNWGLGRVSAHRGGLVLFDDELNRTPLTNSKEYTITFRTPGVYTLTAVDLYGQQAVFGPASYRDNDGDGLSDKYENMIGTRRSTLDTDGDGLGDGDEVLRLHTDPRRVDTDKDSIPDDVEVSTIYNPRLYSSHNSGLGDGVMYALSGFLSGDARREPMHVHSRNYDALISSGLLRELPSEGDEALVLQKDRIRYTGAGQKRAWRVDAAKFAPVASNAAQGLVCGIQEGLLLVFAQRAEGMFGLTAAFAPAEIVCGPEMAETLPDAKVDAEHTTLLIGWRQVPDSACIGALLLYDMAVGRVFEVVGSRDADDFWFSENGLGLGYQRQGQEHHMSFDMR